MVLSCHPEVSQLVSANVESKPDPPNFAVQLVSRKAHPCSVQQGAVKPLPRLVPAWAGIGLAVACRFKMAGLTANTLYMFASSHAVVLVMVHIFRQACSLQLILLYLEKKNLYAAVTLICYTMVTGSQPTWAFMNSIAFIVRKAVTETRLHAGVFFFFFFTIRYSLLLLIQPAGIVKFPIVT